MDWYTFIVQISIQIPAIIISIATLVTALKAKNKTVELADSVNGHMTNLLEKTAIVAEAVGKKEGMAEKSAGDRRKS